MTLKLNGVEIDDLRVNGVKVDSGYLNGAKVYDRFTKTHTLTVGSRSGRLGEELGVDNNIGNINPLRAEGYKINYLIVSKSTSGDENNYIMALIGTLANPASAHIEIRGEAGKYFKVINDGQAHRGAEYTALFNFFKDAYTNNPGRNLNLSIKATN